MYEYCNCGWSHSTVTMLTGQNASRTSIPCSVRYWGEPGLRTPIRPIRTSLRDYSTASSAAKTKTGGKKWQKYRLSNEVPQVTINAAGKRFRWTEGCGHSSERQRLKICSFKKRQCQRSVGLLQQHQGEIEGARRLATTPETLRWMYPLPLQV